MNINISWSLYCFTVLPETISKVIVSSTPDHGPLIGDTTDVTPDRAYDIRGEQNLTDIVVPSKYVDNAIDGQKVGNNVFRLDTFHRSPRCHGNYLKTSVCLLFNN